MRSVIDLIADIIAPDRPLSPVCRPAQTRAASALSPESPESPTNAVTQQRTTQTWRFTIDGCEVVAIDHENRTHDEMQRDLGNKFGPGRALNLTLN